MSPQSEAKTKWDNENTVRVNIKLNKNTDADIIQAIESADSKQGFIKEAIRAYMKADAK